MDTCTTPPQDWLRRQPRDWGQPCPNPDGSRDTRRHQGTVRAIATDLPQRGTRRLVSCPQGARRFSATRAPVFCALRTPAETGMMALTRLLGRGALPGISVGRGVTAETVLAWRRRAAHHAEAIHHPRRRALPVPPGQRDERWHCLGRQPACETDAAGDSVPNGEDGRPGGWGSVAPEWRWMIAAIGGPRTLDPATEGGAAPQARVAGSPAGCREGVTGSRAARIAACHVGTPCASPGKRGRPRQPRGEPPPDLVSGPWGTQQPQGTRLTRSTRVVLGAARRTHVGGTSSPALVERVPWTWRQAVAPLARTTSSVGKDRARRRQRGGCFQACDNRARPHMRLRQPWPPHARTHHGAIRPRWRAHPPAMAAGVTAHVWTFRALLTATFEPLDAQSSSG